MLSLKALKFLPGAFENHMQELAKNIKFRKEEQ